MTYLDAVREHYRRYLGQASSGYSATLSEHPSGAYDIVQYQDTPWEGAITLATCGMSELDLHMFRQELVLVCYRQFLSSDLILSIAGVVEMVARTRHPLLQGQVLAPAPVEPLTADTAMTGLYSSVPTYFPDEFQLVEGEGLKIDVGWLIPVYSTEIRWIEQNGWRAFESLLEEKDPDVMDLARQAVV